ncbi:MAG: O-acetylhomoserine (thiol)-lyase, partial [Candidatus Poriferisodalaceae bacterium]
MAARALVTRALATTVLATTVLATTVVSGAGRAVTGVVSEAAVVSGVAGATMLTTLAPLPPPELLVSRAATSTVSSTMLVIGNSRQPAMAPPTTSAATRASKPIQMTGSSSSMSRSGISLLSASSVNAGTSRCVVSGEHHRCHQETCGQAMRSRDISNTAGSEVLSGLICPYPRLNHIPMPRIQGLGNTMVEPDFLNFDTLSLHAGQTADPTTGARAVPIYQTTSFSFTDSDQAAGLFNLEIPGHLYSRISNPTVAVLEERIAALEGGVGAVCTASGMSAMHLALATLCDAGSHIVASRNIYGGTHNMLNLTMPRFGITTTFVDPRDPQAFRDAIRPETRVVVAETLGNPGIEVLDIPVISDVCHEAGVPLLVDSTFSTPYLMRPFEHGADIVMHSVTKFLGGHGIALGGVIVDGGRFDWTQNDRFPTLTEPYAGYHGISFAEEYGPSALLMRARAEGLRDFGACMSPANAFHLLQGVETLPLRMARHVENTL